MREDPKTSRRSSVSRRTLLSATGGVAGALAADGRGRAKAVAARLRPPGQVDRGFVRIREGLVHYRHTLEDPAPGRAKTLPLLMVHAGPGSSRGLAPLMVSLAASRPSLAPDTLGYGDSAAPDQPQPEIPYYADSVVRVLDALGIEKVDYYGAHTGAHIGCELALHAPDRVRRLIFDGVTVRRPEVRAELLAHYAPRVQPDDYGSQLHWAWLFVRDMSQYFPHYARDARHRLANDVPSAEHLHESTVEVLKALPTYHLTYDAVYRHDIGKRLPLLTHPVLCVAKENDPNIVELDRAAATIPNVRKARIPRNQTVEALGRAIDEFLDA